MASIIKEIQVERPARDVWDAVRDFGAVSTRLVPGFLTDSSLECDDVRVVTFDGGAVARERLVGVDDAAQRLSYTVLESPLDFTAHIASVQVFDDDGCSRVVWTTDALPHSVAPRVDELMTAGITVLKRTLEHDGAH